MKQVHSKGLETKDHERELQVHFLKHLIIFKPSVVLEAWLLVFRLLRKSCKHGLHSHTGEPLPALLSPCCSGKGETTKANSTGHSVTLFSTSICCATIITHMDLLKVSYKNTVIWQQGRADHLLCYCSSGRKLLWSLRCLALPALVILPWVVLPKNLSHSPSYCSHQIWNWAAGNAWETSVHSLVALLST